MLWVISDVHGAGNELVALLSGFGHDVPDERLRPNGPIAHPQINDTIVLAGDMFDRANDAALVWQYIQRWKLVCLMGNHEMKLLKWLRGQYPQGVPPGYVRAWRQLQEIGVHKDEMIDWLEKLPILLAFTRSGYPKPLHRLDGEAVLVAHAGVDIANPSQPDVSMNVYGKLVTEKENRWWANYKCSPLVVYGHTTSPGFAVRTWYGLVTDQINSIGIDTGVAHGGPITAFSPTTNRLLQYQSSVNWYKQYKGVL